MLEAGAMVEPMAALARMEEVQVVMRVEQREEVQAVIRVE